MNFSNWEYLPEKRGIRPAFLPANIVTEFDRTKSQKIFTHKLGRIDFKSVRDLNKTRQQIISGKISETNDQGGYTYKNISHVFSNHVRTSLVNGKYDIYAHGFALEGLDSLGKESCSRAKLKCASGEGTDSSCNPGKCIIGSISRVKNTKWKYESYNTYGDNEEPLSYFFSSEPKIRLKTVVRGSYENLDVTSPASISSTIYLPPKFYFSDDFLEEAFIRLDQRLSELAIKPPKSLVIGIEDRKVLFINKFIISLYPASSEQFLNQKIQGGVSSEIKEGLLEVFSSLESPWYGAISEIIENSYVDFTKTLDFISDVYDESLELFNSIIQVIPSSFSKALASTNSEKIARPVYSRLPGLAEAYRSDPAFSDVTTPAQWLTSGVDEFLSEKKKAIDSFYYDYLDPDTCSPATLDWLAQHVGLVGNLWDTAWEEGIKRGMIKNTFGWWDRESSIVIPAIGEVLTPKGETLSQAPFGSEIWTEDPEEDNSLKVSFSETESIIVNEQSQSIVGEQRYKEKTYDQLTNLLSLASSGSIKFYKELWNGLIESKGSLLVVVFLSSLFNLKAHSPHELEIVDYDRKIFKPKNGLRNAEFLAPTLLPYKYEVLQVGDQNDAKINNYANQLIASVSRASSIEESRNVFFRVPYYYNRDGRSWDKVSYIAKNWLPSNLNVRVQYAYLSADLWAVGDGFFEPQVITQST